MKLAVVSSVFANYPLEHVLPVVAAAGYDGIDVWGGRPHVYRTDLSRARLHALRRQAGDLGLEIVSVMPAFYRYPFSLCTYDEQVRKDSLDYMRQSIDNAVDLDAKTVLMVPGRSLHGQSGRMPGSGCPTACALSPRWGDATASASGWRPSIAT